MRSSRTLCGQPQAPVSEGHRRQRLLRAPLLERLETLYRKAISPLAHDLPGMTLARAEQLPAVFLPEASSDLGRSGNAEARGRAALAWKGSWPAVRCAGSLANLRTFSCLPEREAAGTLTLRGAYCAIADGVLHVMGGSGHFAPAEDRPAVPSHA